MSSIHCRNFGGRGAANLCLGRLEDHSTLLNSEGYTSASIGVHDYLVQVRNAIIRCCLYLLLVPGYSGLLEEVFISHHLVCQTIS